ncbi:MAG: MoaD/ThiS family protein [Deltaproteobacteria bacterium]|nr:MAG: MoaD/ThiS family protein [Deltaproteobacteria bacterium]
MKITVKLFASFREGRFKVESRDIPSSSLVGQLVADLKLPAEKLGVLLVNGRHAELESQLEEGDVCALFPRIGGG